MCLYVLLRFNMLRLLYLLQWSAYFISIVQLSPLQNKCQNQLDGFHTSTESDCRDYYYCSKGKIAQNFTCPISHAFDILKQTCIPTQEALCIDLKCSNTTPNKYFTIPQTKCRMYYKCHGTKRHDYVCPENMSFSYQLQTCVKKGLCYDPVCSGRVNGEYPDTTQDCLRSFKCFGGVITQTQHCASNEIFSENYRQCVTSDSFCRAPQETAIAFPRSNICVKLDDGVYVVPNSACREYFVCKSKIHLGTLTCADGFVFNGRECLPKEKYQCKDSACIEDGLQVDLYSECQDYFYCMDRRMLWKYSCPQNMIHNGIACISQLGYKCPSLGQSVKSCIHKPDGFYRNHAKCNEYYFCADNEIMFTNTCPGNQLWNGHTCVDPGWYYCEGPVEWTGCFLKEGYYADTQCSNYYYCSNGLVTRYSCPPTEAFDGTKCVPKNSHNCPKVCEGDGFQTGPNCESYYVCSNGLKTQFKCPSNELFNGLKCVSKTEYTCPKIDVCVDYADGFFLYPNTNCQKYMQCRDGKLVKDLECKGSEVFNGVNGCVSKNCTIQEQFCLRDGFYADLESGCRSYYFCIENRRTVLECPEGKVFNGQVCVNEGLYKCPENCSVYKSCVKSKSGEDAIQRS